MAALYGISYPMNIAFLFNSDHPNLGGYYGLPIIESILDTNVLISENRNMRVSEGDILTYFAASRSKNSTYETLENICGSVYVPDSYDKLISDKLEATYSSATVFCWLFQNMTSNCANKLHLGLVKREESYLGAMDVVFSNPIHLKYFRNSLVESYRFHGNKCSFFYSMSSNEDPDIAMKEQFEQRGYTVNFEDVGARRTVFDNYDTIEHFERIVDFRDHFLTMAGVDELIADDVIHSLEELHPKLFDSFSAAARTLRRAETEEDFAQASLSGRRVLENLANYLFPPSDIKYKGRKVGNAEFKNRIWAYIESTVEEENAEDSMIKILGKEADRLVALFNAGLHAAPTKAKLEESFRSLLVWISDLIQLSPSKARKPYLAYWDE